MRRRVAPWFTMRRQWTRLALAITAMLALSGAAAAPSSASPGTEQRGAALLETLRAGEKRCDQLSRAQFEAIGEYVMGRMTGSAPRHEAMDRQIRTTAGARGEGQAHEFLGRRFTDCATGAAPAAFGSMMGMMGTFSGAGGMGMGRDGTDGEGMNGGRDGAGGFGPGMTGGADSRMGGDDGWSSTDTVLAILLAAALAALAALRPWRRTPSKSPSDVLSDRYARGDIDTADYQQRRHALGGSA